MVRQIADAAHFLLRNSKSSIESSAAVIHSAVDDFIMIEADVLPAPVLPEMIYSLSASAAKDHAQADENDDDGPEQTPVDIPGSPDKQAER